MVVNFRIRQTHCIRQNELIIQKQLELTIRTNNTKHVTQSITQDYFQNNGPVIETKHLFCISLITSQIQELQYHYISITKVGSDTVEKDRVIIKVGSDTV